MKAIYSCCVFDPFLEVAKRLFQDIGLEPVYWIGDIASVYSTDVEENTLKSLFPNVIYQSYFNAWHGVFPKEIPNSANVELDFLQKFSGEELQALSMMDRLDYDRHSFNFMERERFFLQLVKKWTYILDYYVPDIVISAVNPHRVFDYVLYLLCKYKKIKYVSFQWSMDGGRTYALCNFDEKDSMSDVIDMVYSVEKGTTIEDLPEDIKNNYFKVISDYKTARPSYMMAHDKDDLKNRNLWFLFKRFMHAHSLFSSDSIFKGQSHTIYKSSKHSIENSNFSIFEWYKKRKEVFKYNKYLSDYYNSHTSSIFPSEKYIVFFLHYQPEETTSPNGGIFANQFLCIETLLRNTPKDVLICIKEHPNQFMSHMQGHTKRIKEFYDDLLSNPRVRFVPFEIDSFSLMTNAIAVSTVTGTVGWEAAARKKPVIIFGSTWYERMNGILRIINDKTASLIYQFIEEYNYSEQDIIDYLNAFSKISFRAYRYKGYKESTGISEEESVNNLYNSILGYLN